MDCQKLEKIFRKWYLLTCLAHQFPKSPLLANVKGRLLGWDTLGTTPVFLLGASVTPQCSLCTGPANKAVIIMWLASLNPATVINTSGSSRQAKRRFTQSPTDSLPKKQASSSKLWLVICCSNKHLRSGQSPPAGSTVQETHTASMRPGVSIEIK